MVLQLDAPPVAGDVIPLRRPQLEVSQECLAELEQLASLIYVTPLEEALELAVTIALLAVRESAAYCLPVPLAGAGDHKRGPSDG